MSFIPQEIIDEIIARNDIESVVREYVQLDKKSGSNIFGLCPFHSENTPSFSVNTAKNFFYCFGCHAGGNVIKFIQMIENLTFPDAVLFLAKRVGIEVELNDDPEARKKQNYYKQMSACLLDAARFFYKSFIDPGAKQAKYYLQRQRKLSAQVLTTFGVGYAPDTWDSLTKYLYARGYSEPMLIELGLTRRSRQGTTYDFFRNRIMFPVFDHLGRLIAFGGRTLGDDEAKYINSPDSRIYSKGNCLYALNFARKEKSGFLILCEGYMDTISLYENGFRNTVAGLGTALTPGQARLLGQYTKKIILAYDSDPAGQNAVLKAIPLLEKEQIECKVLVMPEGLDPDDYIHNYGKERFSALLDNALPALDFRLLLAKNKASTPQGSVDILAYQDLATDILSGVANAVVRELYSDRLAKDIQISPASIMEVVEKKRSLEYAERTKKERPLAQRKKKSFVLEKNAIAYLAALVEDNSIVYEAAEEVKVSDFQEEIRNFIGEVLSSAKKGELTFPKLLNHLEKADSALGLKERILPYFSKIRNQAMRSIKDFADEALKGLRISRLEEEKITILQKLEGETNKEIQTELLHKVNSINLTITKIRNEVGNE